MDSSSDSSNAIPRRRSSASKTTKDGRQGRRSSQTAAARVQGQPSSAPDSTSQRGGTASRILPQLASSAWQQVKGYLPGSAALAPSSPVASPSHQKPTVKHTCGRQTRKGRDSLLLEGVPLDAMPPAPAPSLFTEKGLLSRAMSSLGLNATPEPSAPPCSACEAEKTPKPRTGSYTSTVKGQGQGQGRPPHSQATVTYTEPIHRGYEMLHHPSDRNASRNEGDVNSDESERIREKMKRVKAVGDFESFGSNSSSSAGVSSSGSRSYSDDDADAKLKGKTCHCKGKGKKVEKEGEVNERKREKRRQKSFSVIKNGDLSPDSRRDRRNMQRAAKECQQKMDEIGELFKPSCLPGAEKMRRGDDSSGGGGAGSSVVRK